MPKYGEKGKAPSYPSWVTQKLPPPESIRAELAAAIRAFRDGPEPRSSAAAPSYRPTRDRAPATPEAAAPEPAPALPEAVDRRERGTIRVYSADTGHGYVKPDGGGTLSRRQTVRFDRAVAAGIADADLTPGREVAFSVERDADGSLRVSRLTLADPGLTQHGGNHIHFDV